MTVTFCEEVSTTITYILKAIMTSMGAFLPSTAIHRPVICTHTHK